MLKLYKHLTDGEIVVVESGSAQESEILADVVTGASYRQQTGSGKSQEVAAAQGTALWQDVTTELASGGISVLRIPFAFDDPDILTGKELYIPTPGDWILGGSAISISEAFDGSSPTLYVAAEGNDPSSQSVASTTTAVVDADIPLAAPHLASIQERAVLGGPFHAVDATPLVLILDDGAGGDPGSTQGAGEVRLLVVPA